MPQVKDEIAKSLDFLQAVYGVFGFSFKLYLSTRPEKYMGDLSLWDMAEKVITNSLSLPISLLLHSLTHSLTHPLTHSHTHSLTRPLTHSRIWKKL